MPYQPRVTQGFQTNYAPAMAHFGQQIAQGIREGQRKREEKKQKDSAIGFFQDYLNFSELEAKDIVGTFSTADEALRAGSMLYFEKRKQDEVERATGVKEGIEKTKVGIAQQEADIAQQNADTAEKRLGLLQQEFDLANSPEQLAIAQQKAEAALLQARVNALNADTAAEKAALETERWEINKKILESKKPPEKLLSDGTLLYFNGESWEEANSRPMSKWEEWKTKAELTDPNGSFSEYNKRVGHDTGERKQKGFFKWREGVDLDPMIEKMRKDAGLSNFYEEAMKEAGIEIPKDDTPKNSKTSQAEPVYDRSNPARPTTTEEFNALKEGSYFINPSDNQLRVK